VQLGKEDEVATTRRAEAVAIRRYPTGVRESPYLEFAIEEGAIAAVPYNRMWLPVSFGRDTRVEYEALLERVVLWDVGCERALEVSGPDAIAFSDYLLTRDVSAQAEGQCRHAIALYEDATIICEALVIRLGDERLWICHGPADFPSWARGIALHSDYQVELREAPVSPLALQGPRSLEVMQELAPNVAEMARFRWAWTTIAGEEVLVSRTGWSGEFGYEVFARDDEPAKRVWREIRRAAEPHGVLVTPVIGVRAWERGITDIRYADNLDLNPYEVGLGRSVDLDKPARFIGQERLREIHANGPRRHTVAFVIEGEDVPDATSFWPVAEPGGRMVGSIWHVLYSYALDRYAGDALVENDLPEGTKLVLQSPNGPLAATVVARPIAGRTSA
jgi:glycine cleavage system aminomethyltransferase T